MTTTPVETVGLALLAAILICELGQWAPWRRLARTETPAAPPGKDVSAEMAELLEPPGADVHIYDVVTGCCTRRLPMGHAEIENYLRTPGFLVHYPDGRVRTAR